MSKFSARDLASTLTNQNEENWINGCYVQNNIAIMMTLSFNDQRIYAE